MESKKIYEESGKELRKIRKSIGSKDITIDVSKLDEVTKERLLSSINNVISERLREIEKVTLGVQ